MPLAQVEATPVDVPGDDEWRRDEPPLRGNAELLGEPGEFRLPGPDPRIQVQTVKLPGELLPSLFPLLRGQLAAAGEPTIVQLGLGGFRMAAAVTVRGRVRIPHRRAGAHRGEAGRAQFGVPTIALRAPGRGLLGTACLLLRGRWQELTSARGMHGHTARMALCSGQHTPFSGYGSGGGTSPR